MIHRFDRFELDEDRFELRRIAPEGEASIVEVQPKVMEVLLQLARHPLRTLTKDELLDEVWGDVAVGEASLTRCISLARRALDDHEGEPRLIKTVRGRGYAMGVEVETVSGPSASPAAPESKQAVVAVAQPLRRARTAKGLALLVFVLALVWLARPFAPELVAPPPSEAVGGPSRAQVAVLPFRDLRSASRRSLEADGLAMEVIEGLVTWPELEVISPRSSFRFDPSGDRSTAEIGRELGAGTLVVGTLRSEAERGIRVHIAAVEAATGIQRWSSSFAGEEPKGWESGIADRVAEALGADASLNPLRPQVADAGAQAILLRGQDAVRSADRERLLDAVELYERALERDPDHVRAYVALAEVALVLWEREGEMGGSSPNWLAAAEATVLEALKRAPDSPQALSAQGQIHLAGRDWRGAEEALRRSLEQGGGERSSSRMAALLMMTGRVEEARPHIERAVRLDPLGDETLRLAGRFHLYAREPERAIGYLGRALEIEPRALYVSRLLADAYRMRGDLDAAREAYLWVMPRWARPLIRIQDRLLGTQRNLRFLLWLDATRSGKRCRADPHATALVYGAIGDREPMLACLEEAARHHLWYVAAEPSFDAFREDPAFLRILRESGFAGGR